MIKFIVQRMCRKVANIFDTYLFIAYWMMEICENPLSAGSLISGLRVGGQLIPGWQVNQGAWQISSGPLTLSDSQSPALLWAPSHWTRQGHKCGIRAPGYWPGWGSDGGANSDRVANSNHVSPERLAAFTNQESFNKINHAGAIRKVMTLYVILLWNYDGCRSVLWTFNSIH